MRSRLLDRSLRLGCLSPLLGIVGCRAPSPPSIDSPRPPTAAAPASAPTPAGLSAFVVVGYEETLVIPIDPALAVETLEGQWVGSLPGTPPGGWGTALVMLSTDSDPELPSLPVCPSGAFYGTCSLELDASEAPNPHRALQASTTVLLAKAEVVRGQAPRWSFADIDSHEPCACVIVHGISTDGVPLDLDDPDVKQAMGSYVAEEYFELCKRPSKPDLEPTTYLGGVLYRNGLMHEGVCTDGPGISVGARDDVPLRPGATPPTAAFPELVGCQADASLNEVDLDALATSGLACDPREQLLAYSLNRGRLVRTIGSADGSPDSGFSFCSCASWLPVTPASCPSPLDPCGSGEGFASRDAWDELWVTTDERFALARDEDGLAVLASDRTTPLRRVELEDTILGVEHHPDTELLGVAPPPDGVRVALPARHESDEAFEGSAAAWASRCAAHLKAERLDAAEAACFAGLLEGGTDGTRGTLTYDLGRIAEARGERERARAYYERSQRLRPQKATAERLRALVGP
jgi:hypothetical protein